MTLVNLTPHDINVYHKLPTATSGPDIIIKFGGLIARCSTTQERLMEVDGIEVRRRKFGDVHITNPKEITPNTEFKLAHHPGVYYIVSRIVAEALPERTDLLFPDGIIRDADGTPIGCTGLASLSEVKE